MKDLYRRNNLESGESNVVKIHGIDNSGFEEDREAAFSILLNQTRKNVYDNTHKTLKSIGLLRTKFNLNTADWKNNNSDYVALFQKSDFRQSAKKGDSVFQSSATHNETSKSNIDEKSTSNIRRENVNPTFSRDQYNTPLPDHKNSKLNVLVQKSAWACGAVFLGVMIWLMFSGHDSGVEAGVPKKQNKYAINRSVNVYSKPSLSETVVATLQKYEDVTVNPVKSKSEWDFVDVGENGAYILKEELALGSGENKLREDCRMDGVTRPETSELLLYRPTGIHKLIISNPPGSDALLKMKSSHGKTMFFAYIREGENFIVENIAEGDYYFEFSVGDNYGPSCGRFLDEAYVVRDQEPKYFSPTLDGFKQHPKTISYVLKNEIFNTKRIPMRDF